MIALPYSVIESWLLVGAALFAACGLGMLLCLRPARHADTVLAPELRGPARGSRWSRGERFELAFMAAGLVLAVVLACVLGPTLDRHDAIAKDTRNTAYAAKE